MHTIRRLILATITTFTFAVTDGLADSYPDQRITLVIPFPAGGPTDSIARPLAQALTSSLGQSVIVENRAGGAGGTLGMRDVARAAPDGYTLTLGTVSTLAVAPAFYKDPGFDPIRSFIPICTVSSEGTVLVAAPQVTARTLEDVIAYAKANPGKLNYGAATGTLAHLAGELFKLSTGTNIVFVPYKGGAAGLTDVLGGQVDLFFTTTSLVTPVYPRRQAQALDHDERGTGSPASRHPHRARERARFGGVLLDRRGCARRHAPRNCRQAQ